MAAHSGKGRCGCQADPTDAQKRGARLCALSNHSMASTDPNPGCGAGSDRGNRPEWNRASGPYPSRCGFRDRLLLAAERVGLYCSA